MQAVGRRYVVEFNSIHRRTGTLWDGRYRASLVEPSSPVLTVYRYLDTLASIYGLEERFGEYPWSSHHCHTRSHPSPVVRDHPIYERISADPDRRRARYRELCAVPLNEHVKREVVKTVRHGLVLGSESFKDRIARDFSVRVRLGRPGRPPKASLAPRLWSPPIGQRLPSLA
jgi:putative transposase